jgi:hypothetical protein
LDTDWILEPTIKVQPECQNKEKWERILQVLELGRHVNWVSGHLGIPFLLSPPQSSKAASLLPGETKE